MDHRRLALFCVAIAIAAGAGKPENVLIVVNTNSALSRDITEYYARRRNIPQKNICPIRAPEKETVSREEFNRQIADPVKACLTSRRLIDSILYIVITQGVPLRVAGSLSPAGDNASVDSELTLLYTVLRGSTYQAEGPLPNPFFRQRDADFKHPQFPIYLVTRLAAYDLAGVKALIDRSLAAKNTGKFVLDLRGSADEGGDQWLRNAAILLPASRVVLEQSQDVV